MTGPSLSAGRRTAVVAMVAALWCTGADASTAGRELVVCADPRNLPASDDRLEGYENRIAALVAAELGASVRYVWTATWRGSYLRPLRQGRCDVLMGVAAGMPGVLTTRPWLTSSYVFVSANRRGDPPRGFDDGERLGRRIGLHAIVAERANTPPANALARRGLGDRVVGYPMWGETPDVAGAIVDDVAAGRIDSAVVWGPIAGWYARRHGDALALTATGPDPRQPAVPFVYGIAIGVREDDMALRSELQAILDRKQQDIRSVLAEFSVPLADGEAPAVRADLHPIDSKEHPACACAPVQSH